MSEGSANNLDIKRYWGLVLRRKYLALSVGLAVLSICTWGGFIWPKTYEASSTVYIQHSTVMDPLIKGVGISSNIEERLKTINDSMKSRNLIAKVIKKLGMDAGVADTGKLEGMITKIQKKITVDIKTARGSADMFIISYQGSDPQKVRDIVNTVISEYVAQNIGLNRSDVSGAYDFIQSQLMEYKAKLDDSDKDIRSFREKNPNMIPQTESAVLTRMESYQTQRIDADIKVKELMRKRESLKRQLSGEKELTVAMVTREGSPQARLDYLNSQLVILMTKYTNRHPDVLKTKAEIEELRRQISNAKASPSDVSGSETSTTNPIYQQLREELVKTDAEIDSLKGRSSELIRQQQEAKSVLGGMPKEQEEWSKLQRDRNVYQKIYDDLLQKLETARVSKDLESTGNVSSFKVVDPALLPIFPVKPDRIKLILLGIFLGAAAGIGAVIGLDYLNHAFKDEDSIESSLKLPVLVAIPSVVNESETLAVQEYDRKVLIAAAAYMGLILLVLIKEVLYKYLSISLMGF